MQIAVVLIVILAACMADKLSIKVYYESLCPGCSQFISEQMNIALSAKGVLDVIDLHLVPYGNAKESEVGGKFAYTCQHGAMVCHTCEINKV
jgi:interferon gamma-inducible protein 30